MNTAYIIAIVCACIGAAMLVYLYGIRENHSEDYDAFGWLIGGVLFLLFGAFTAADDGSGTAYAVAATPETFSAPSAGDSGFTVGTDTSGSGNLSGTGKWFGGVLAPNGKIYGIPFNSNSVLVIETGQNDVEQWVLSAYQNKF